VINNVTCSMHDLRDLIYIHQHRAQVAVYKLLLLLFCCVIVLTYHLKKFSETIRRTKS